MSIINSDVSLEPLMSLIDEGYSPQLSKLTDLIEGGYNVSYSTFSERLLLRKGNHVVRVPEDYEWFVMSYYNLKKKAKVQAKPIFLSYSHRDLDIAYKIYSIFSRIGIPCYLAELYPEPGVSLWNKIEEMINRSAIVVVIWTRNSYYSPYVNQELGAAKRAGKRIIPLVEEGAELKGVLEGMEYVKLDRKDWVSTVSSLLNATRLHLEKSDQSVALALLALAAGILFLRTSSEKK